MPPVLAVRIGGGDDSGSAHGAVAGPGRNASTVSANSSGAAIVMFKPSAFSFFEPAFSPATSSDVFDDTLDDALPPARSIRSFISLRDRASRGPVIDPVTAAVMP